MPEQSSPQSRRSWLRLSLRGLMIFVLLAGGWLGWLAHRANVQRKAVAAIQHAGGRAWYDWEWKISSTGHFAGGSGSKCEAELPEMAD